MALLREDSNRCLCHMPGLCLLSLTNGFQQVIQRLPLYQARRFGMRCHLHRLAGRRDITGAVFGADRHRIFPLIQWSQLSGQNGQGPATIRFDTGAVMLIAQR